ncbi:ABC transporter ATP-binding protein [Oceanimonas baumannii]|uniref:ABC transporter ATP-binding protein n=1 Tax=Oceanimonas baumannii TaxID=129578 RepID=A0A235CM84_9GAMM|nr:ABC transporter ATP-binding protein [Oceanimonas baumannii]OYD25672.1 ABC transporter ATP-binding protein [Oceanimonas baumannii]TDW56988.1 lipopolysaccharide transport system ATP-binding protein [Oceanimonas baumannii]
MAVIKVDQVSKSFVTTQSPWALIKKHLLNIDKVPLFQALKNISFHAEAGETIGIVGHNGSGKSTLLQIICGVMQPDSGEVQVNGRVAALLELGSGFNPEFTGRENVYFNATLLGLSTREVDKAFNHIVEFSGIGEFLDQPVKSYSSGMMLRLAFSVIIHSNPDILIVDEALAVGDEAFQRKCYAKLKQLQASGATLLFVSHSAGQVVELCDRAVLLDHGEILMVGKPKQVVHSYHKLLHMESEQKKRFRAHLKNEGAPESYQPDEAENKESSVNNTGSSIERLNHLLQPETTVWFSSNGALLSNPHIENMQGEIVNLLESGQRYRYCYHAAFDEEAFEVGFGMMIKSVSGLAISGSTTIRDHVNRIPYVAAGSQFKVSFEFDCLLRNGTYFLNCGCSKLVEGERISLHRGVDVAMFQVVGESASVTGMIDLGAKFSVQS